MQVLGSGLLAQKIIASSGNSSNALIFARGVSDSSCRDLLQYERECLHLFEAIIDCQKTGRRLVYFSSAGAIYGDSDEIKCEKSPLFPKTPYGRHKLLCESVIVNSGINFLILRLPNIIGHGGNPNQLIPFLVSSVYNGKVRLQKNATRDLIGIDDTVRILDALLNTVRENLIVNVASGHSVSVIDIMKEIQYTLKKSVEIEYVEGGQQQRFAIGRLQKLLPSLVHFEPDYYKSLISEYL